MVGRSHFDRSPAAGTRHNRSLVVVEVAEPAVAKEQSYRREARSCCSYRCAAPAAAVAVAAAARVEGRQLGRSHHVLADRAAKEQHCLRQVPVGPMDSWAQRYSQSGRIHLGHSRDTLLDRRSMGCPIALA